MAAESKIEWTDSTFSPWSGCTKISPACDHCYAEALSKRAPKTIGQWGAGAPRRRTSAAYWKQPLRWNAESFVACSKCGWRGGVLSLGPATQPQACPTCGSRVGDGVAVARRRVFCASLADVFDNEVDPGWRADLFDLIANTPNLDWLLLTKRIGNAADMINAALLDDGPQWPWPNIWLGATICNQAEADRDIPKLLATPAAKRFLSIEPMLGPVDLRRLLRYKNPSLNIDALTGWTTRGQLGMAPGECSIGVSCSKELPALDWVICGGESGPHARPMHPDWARSLRDQCAAAGVQFLFKQWGEWIPAGQRAADAPKVMTREMQMGHEAAGRFSFARLSDDAHISTDVPVWRVGKHAAGRLLDGVEHNGVPA